MTIMISILIETSDDDKFPADKLADELCDWTFKHYREPFIEKDLYRGPYVRSIERAAIKGVQ